MSFVLTQTDENINLIFCCCCCCCRNDFEDLFDIIITNALKPGFFSQTPNQRPFRTLGKLELNMWAILSYQQLRFIDIGMNIAFWGFLKWFSMVKKNSERKMVKIRNIKKQDVKAWIIGVQNKKEAETILETSFQFHDDRLWS